MKVADTRKWDSEWPNIATPSRDPGWPAQSDRWSEGETQKTNSQSPDTNWGPLSETTSAGRPWMRKTWSTTVAAVSLAEGNLGKGIKWAAFENRSTTVKTTVLPREGGRAVTKSSAIWDQGLEGTDSGWSNPSGGRLEVLPRAQTEQAKTNSRISRAMARHQNRCLTKNMVRPIPGWQATLEQWPHWMTLDRNPSGTNNRPVGHPGGGVTPSKAVRTFRFDLPSDCRDNQSLRYDALGRHRAVRNIKNAWQGIGFDVLWTRPIGDGKIKTSEK